MPFLPLSFLNHFIVSFHSLLSIVLSHLRPSISIPRCNVITRILLQRIGLRLRALRIELFAKLAFALRCLGSFLVVKERGQLSVSMLKMWFLEPAIRGWLLEAVVLGASRSKQSQPSASAHSFAAYPD